MLAKFMLDLNNLLLLKMMAAIGDGGITTIIKLIQKFSI